jgi:hypothetical protein
VSGSNGARNLLPGHPLIAAFDESMTPKATMQLPDGTKKNVDVVRVGDHYESRYADTYAPGIYILRAHRRVGNKTEEVKLQYVVQSPRDESDLTALTTSEWAALAGRMDLEMIEPAAGSIASALTAARSGKELWLSLVLAVVALGLGELALERFWMGRE